MSAKAVPASCLTCANLVRWLVDKTMAPEGYSCREDDAVMVDIDHPATHPPCDKHEPRPE